MALRLMNTGKHPLTVDLRGGEALVLAPGETSPPLREEGLYGHPHLSAWVAAGVVQRLPARMDDVLEHEAALGLPGPAAVEDAEEEDEDGAEDDGADAAVAEAGAADVADAEAEDGGGLAIDFVPDEGLIAGVDAADSPPARRGRRGGRGAGSRKSR
jgi:hypothetical protein